MKTRTKLTPLRAAILRDRIVDTKYYRGARDALEGAGYVACTVHGFIVTGAGREAVDEYDAEFVPVRRSVIEIAVDVLSVAIKTHDCAFAGFPYHLAMIDDVRSDLAELQDALAGEV